MKVGDTIWYNRRERRSDTADLDKYVPEKITGETLQSWLIVEFGRTTRVNKKTLKSSPDRYGQTQYYASMDDIKRMVWVDKNGWRIADAVRQVKDKELLKTIADLIGYQE